MQKAHLADIQAKSPPLGNMLTLPTGALRRIYLSPGKVLDVDGYGDNWWRLGRAMHAADFRAGEIIHNSFSHHFTPAGMMVDDGAASVGCAVFPAGPHNMAAQAAMMSYISATAYCGIPETLDIILKKAR